MLHSCSVIFCLGIIEKWFTRYRSFFLPIVWCCTFRERAAPRGSQGTTNTIQWGVLATQTRLTRMLELTVTNVYIPRSAHSLDWSHLLTMSANKNSQTLKWNESWIRVLYMIIHKWVRGKRRWWMIKITCVELQQQKCCLCEQSPLSILVSNRKWLVVSMPRKPEWKPEARLWLASSSLYSIVSACPAHLKLTKLGLFSQALTRPPGLPKNPPALNRQKNMHIFSFCVKSKCL